MSYILDALKRAEAERERGHVPGLHSQQALAQAPNATESPRWHVLAGTAALLLVLGAAAVAWWWPRPAAVLVLAQGTGTAPAPVQTPTPATTPAPAPVPTPAPPPEAPKAAPQTARPAPPPPDTRPTPATRPSPATKARSDREPASQGRERDAPVPLLSELTDGQRRDVPALHITGAVYSANPAQRLLLVNNQVLPQGSTVAPGLVVEEIQANGSVFSFKGNRFRVSH